MRTLIAEYNQGYDQSGGKQSRCNGEVKRLFSARAFVILRIGLHNLMTLGPENQFRRLRRQAAKAVAPRATRLKAEGSGTGRVAGMTKMLSKNP